MFVQLNSVLFDFFRFFIFDAIFTIFNFYSDDKSFKIYRKNSFDISLVNIYSKYYQKNWCLIVVNM